MSIKRILVIGASGGVGRFICKEVIRSFQPSTLVVGDYKIERGQRLAHELGKDVVFRYVDIHNSESQITAFKKIDAIIVAVQQRQPVIQSVCLSKRIPCFDITLRGEFIQKVHELNKQASSFDTPLLMMAGLFPGLSGIIIKSIVEQFKSVQQVDVAFLQSINGTTGAMGIADMLGAFAQPVVLNTSTHSEELKGFNLTKEFIFPEPFGVSKARLINYDEADVISQKLGIKNINYWTAFNVENFNRVLVFLNRIKILRLFQHPKWRLKLAKIIEYFKNINRHKNEKISLLVKVTGNVNKKNQIYKVGLIGPSDYGVTALVVVALVKLVVEDKIKSKGVLYPFEIVPFEMLLKAINSNEIKIFEDIIEL